MIRLINPSQIELREPLAYIPLGLGYIASSIIKEGYEPFDDIMIDNLADTDMDNIKLDYADVYGISYMSSTKTGVMRIVSYIREKYPDSNIIIGGPHPSVSPLETYETMKPDVVIEGEAERLFPRLVENIFNGDNVHTIYNAKLIECLDELPFPARRLFDYKNVVNTTGIHGQDKGQRATTMITSRGCPFDCKFCCKGHDMYNKYRYRSPENVKYELIGLKEDYGIEHVRFVDDCFTLNKDRAKKICEYTKELDISFMSIARADTCDLNTLKMLKSGGCKILDIGLESGSPKLLKDMNKRETIDDIKKCLLNAKKIGLNTKVFLQYDLPGETEEDIQKTIDFLKETKPDFYTLSRYTSLPGSEWYTQKGWFYDDNDDKRNELINRIEVVL